jgi:hypothetical protein
MKIAYYTLHYGKEYLAWSIRSIQDAVDEIHMLYTKTPSFGHGTSLMCPDTEEELRSEAARFANKPIIWHTGSWGNEGQHRNTILGIAAQRNANMILVVDADELWDPETAKTALQRVEDYNNAGTTRVRFVHFWRSLDWVCYDAAMPNRITDTRHPLNKEWYLDPQSFPVLHFGYAQSEKLMDYKWHIHGHQNELRPDWWNTKFLGWQPGVNDVHPTCSQGFWNPQKIEDPLKSKVHELLHDHPYFGKEKII